jgi:hypothetical protein
VYSTRKHAQAHAHHHDTSSGRVRFAPSVARKPQTREKNSDIQIKNNRSEMFPRLYTFEYLFPTHIEPLCDMLRRRINGTRSQVILRRFIPAHPGRSLAFELRICFLQKGEEPRQSPCLCEFCKSVTATFDPRACELNSSGNFSLAVVGRIFRFWE